MNCFSISVYVSNHTPRSNHAVFGVYLTPAPVIVVLYYMLILVHQQHLLVDGAVLSVSLQMSSSLDYVGYDLLLTHLPRSPQSTHLPRLSQPSPTSVSVVCRSPSVVLLGCRLGVDSLLRSVWTCYLVGLLWLNVSTVFYISVTCVFFGSCVVARLELWHPLSRVIL